MKASSRFVAWRLLALSLLFTSVAVGCLGPQDPKDLPFRSGTIDLRADGSRERALLATPAVLDGYPCDGWVMWHDNGVLMSFDLSTDHELSGHRLPARTRVFLDRAGRLAHAWLPRDTRVGPYVCRGGMKIDTAFHPDGSLKAFFPPDDLVIDGVTCEASVFHPIYLHPNGRLWKARVAVDVIAGERHYAAGSDIELSGSPPYPTVR
ncbi:MAG: hypothetical protein FJ299_09705 [Planctomycetes bacterium]|nr:hypothetical protein [Planctomycetota bacterium]